MGKKIEKIQQKCQNPNCNNIITVYPKSYRPKKFCSIPCFQSTLDSNNSEFNPFPVAKKLNLKKTYNQNENIELKKTIKIK